MTAERSKAELSVVIATYNGADRLRSCLASLEAQTLAREGEKSLELIVVVDGSTDRTREVLSAYRPPFRLRVVQQENAGQATALNRGVEESPGRFCLLLDDDIVAGPGAAAEHLAAQREHGGVLAAGRLVLRVPPDADWYVRRFAGDWEAHYGRLDGGAKRLGPESCYGANLSFPRSTFLSAGGFAADLRRGYDVDLARRLVAAGLSPRYLPAAVCVQNEHKTGVQLLGDEERAGEAMMRLYRRDRAALATSGLAGYHAAGAAALFLRRALFGARVSAERLASWGPLPDRVTRGRWFRFVRQYAFWSGVRRAATPDEWAGLTGAVVILLYHAVTEPGERPSRFVVAERDFEWQMRWLSRRGYAVTSLEAYVRARREHRLPPARCVVVTFDDGYADNARRAAPVLASLGFPATIFLVTDRVGDANRWDSDGALAGRPILSWKEARMLERSGISFAPHGRTHRVLTNLEPEELAGEIGEAWATVQRELSGPVPVLAFPFGLHDASVRAASERAGLLAACTAKPGKDTLQTPLDALRRAEIGGGARRMGFRFAVWFGDARLGRGRPPEAA